MEQRVTELLEERLGELERRVDFEHRRRIAFLEERDGNHRDRIMELEHHLKLLERRCAALEYPLKPANLAALQTSAHVPGLEERVTVLEQCTGMLAPTSPAPRVMDVSVEAALIDRLGGFEDMLADHGQRLTSLEVGSSCDVMYDEEAETEAAMVESCHVDLTNE